LAILIVGVCAQAQENPRVVDPEFLSGWSKELSTRCAARIEVAAGCLRGLERAIETLSGRSGRLLLEDSHEAQLTSAGGPLFKVGPLVFREDSRDILAHQRRLAVENPKAFSRSEHEFDRRFAAMALSQKIGASDWDEAFAWVNSRVKTDEDARKVFARLFSAERFEIEKDPYSYVRVHHEYPATIENRPLTLEYVEGRYLVSKIRPNSKADLAGLQVGMTLESVDGTALTPENVSALLKQFNSTATSKARFREAGGGGAFEIPYWGKEEPLPGFHQFLLPMPKGSVGVIEIVSFNTRGLCGSVREQLLEFAAAGIKALIVDLRRNTGGGVDATRCIAGLLMGGDVPLVNMRALVRDVHSYEVRSSFSKVLKSMPMFMLMDWRSASASEILAGAAQERQAAWIVGERSFGKGIAQAISPLYVHGERIDGMDQVRTVYRFEFGSGHSPQVTGIEPDLPVGSSIAGVDGEASAVRFADRFGEVFRVQERAASVEASRARRLKRLRACVGRAQLARPWRQNPSLNRWLADQQLRVAALASQCEIGLHLRAAEISPR
jgi:C-terminal processing protease CtpA/Prc